MAFLRHSLKFAFPLPVTDPGRFRDSQPSDWPEAGNSSNPVAVEFLAVSPLAPFAIVDHARLIGRHDPDQDDQAHDQEGEDSGDDSDDHTHQIITPCLSDQASAIAWALASLKARSCAVGRTIVGRRGV